MLEINLEPRLAAGEGWTERQKDRKTLIRKDGEREWKRRKDRKKDE